MPIKSWYGISSNMVPFGNINTWNLKERKHWKRDGGVGREKLITYNIGPPVLATITLTGSDIVFLFQLAWNLGQCSRLTKWPRVYLERTMLAYLNRRVREVTSFTKALRSVSSHLEGTRAHKPQHRFWGSVASPATGRATQRSRCSEWLLSYGKSFRTTLVFHRPLY